MKSLFAIFLSWTCVSAFSPVAPIVAKNAYRHNQQTRAQNDASVESDTSVDLCIIGGGISGLSAAIEAATLRQNAKIIVLESQQTPGGRVSSDFINGYTLDRGYAVFIKEYPQSKKLFDYEALKLKSYDPGAMIKIKSGGFTLVADPLRQPSKLIQALTTKVGTFSDKLRLAPLFYHVKTKSVEELFEEEEMDTLSCLKDKYKFSEKMIREFFEPFMVGIYLSPLDQQSSRMFHFVFKMFADGAGTLPTGGMQAVSTQLMEKAIRLGVDVQLNQSVSGLTALENGFQIETKRGASIYSNSVICATEGPNAEKMLSRMEGLESLSKIEKQPQRSVGCFYYTFSTKSPVNDKILVLNGEGIDSGPALTVNFLHRINDSYAPKECGLCSVSIPEMFMNKYKGKEKELDLLVRRQLGAWWPDFKDDIDGKWHLEKTYDIKCAQPAQLGGSFPANVHGGSIASQLRGLELPTGLFVCGDYMATSTLNGAIESGINAAKAAS